MIDGVIELPVCQHFISEWTPSIAPSGLTVYDGDRFPGWRGNLFVGALRFRLIVRVVLDGERVVYEERLFNADLRGLCAPRTRW